MGEVAGHADQAGTVGMSRILGLLTTLWTYASMALLAIACLPIMLLPRKNVHGAIRFWGRGVVGGFRWILGTPTEFRGEEHVPDHPVLYAAKHQSTYDIIAPFLFIRDPAVILKRELLFYPFFGWYALRTHMIPIHRGGTMKTLKKMTRIAHDRVKDGRSVVIFPEGSRKKPDDEPDYKIGVFALYKALDIPCLPIATNSGLCWPSRGFDRHRGKVVFEALEPIPPGLSRAEFMERLERQTETATKKLIAEGRDVQAQLGITNT